MQNPEAGALSTLLEDLHVCSIDQEPLSDKQIKPLCNILVCSLIKTLNRTSAETLAVE